MDRLLLHDIEKGALDKRVKKNRSLYISIVGLYISLLSIGNASGQDTCDVSTNYPWLNLDVNMVQYFSKSSLANFSAKWYKNGFQTITIAHLGDSHVQPDYYSGELRKNLQQIKGNAGRGMIFPFSVAKTYNANDYSSTYTGSWKCSKSIEHFPKLPLGASGATCHTFDPNASFTIHFKNPVHEHNKILKLFCKKSDSSFDLIVKSAEHRVVVLVDGSDKSTPYVEVELPEVGNTITVQVMKHHTNETEFQFYGMSLESTQKSGVMLHCLGIGGAQYGSILWQSLFQEQLPFLNPDLVIVDFGTNDYIYTDMIPDNLEKEIKNVIKKVRFSAPKADILLTSTQDMNRKGKNLKSGEAFSDLIRKIAREENCAFYDWYWVAGGPRVMTKWEARALALPDMIHLSPPGYKLKGQLLSEALLKTLSIHHSSRKDSLVVFLDSLKAKARREEESLPKEIVPVKSPTKNTQTVPSGYKIIYHKIKPGETLSTIAQRYHVTSNAIMSLNNMRTTKIIAGNTLKIRVKK